MNRKTIAMTLSILMVLSCFTAVTFASDDSDAVDGPEAGSAWGLGASFDRSDIIDIVNSAITEMGLGEYIELITDDGVITEDNYIKVINKLLRFADSKVDAEITELDMTGDAWMIYEVVEKNSNGYVVDYATVFGTDITFAGTFSDRTMDEDADELVIEKLKVGLYFYEKGSVHLDRDFAVTSLDSNYRLSMQFDLSSNIDFTDDGPELVDRIVDNSYFINLDGSLDAILIDGVMHLLPTGDEMTWNDRFDIRMDMTASINTNIPDLIPHDGTMNTILSILAKGDENCAGSDINSDLFGNIDNAAATGRTAPGIVSNEEQKRKAEEEARIKKEEEERLEREKKEEEERLAKEKEEEERRKKSPANKLWGWMKKFGQTIVQADNENM